MIDLPKSSDLLTPRSLTAKGSWKPRIGLEDVCPSFWGDSGPNFQGENSLSAKRDHGRVFDSNGKSDYRITTNLEQGSFYHTGPQTMHSNKGNLSKLPQTCIAWFPPKKKTLPFKDPYTNPPVEIIAKYPQGSLDSRMRTSCDTLVSL